MSEKLLIVGTGGHAKEVLDVAESHWMDIVGFLDEQNAEETRFRGFPIVMHPDDLEWDKIFIAIGDSATRAEYCRRFEGQLCEALIHPSAVISSSATIGDGTIIMPQAVISSDAVIGEGSIVGACSYVAHDCRVGDYTHIATGCMLNGNTIVGSQSMVGSGTVTRQGASIGDNAVCGAGSVVIEPVADGTVAVGCPARPTAR